MQARPELARSRQVLHGWLRCERVVTFPPGAYACEAVEKGVLDGAGRRQKGVNQVAISERLLNLVDSGLQLKRVRG